MYRTFFRKLLRRLSRDRTLRLTPEGGRFLFFTLAVGVAAVNTGNNLFYLLLAMMLSLIVLSGLLSEQCLRRLEFRRHAPDMIVANQPATLSLSVSNRKLRLPSFSLRLYDVVAGQDVERGLSVRHVPAQQSLLLSYAVLMPRRGSFLLEGVRVATPFPFGLFLKKAFYPLPQEIVVCPEISPLPEGFLRHLAGSGRDRSLPRRGHGAELYNLRLYRPGDDSRSIHWMTTARTAQLIVRETAAEDQRRVTIVVSTVAPDEWDDIFERGLSVAASLAWHFEAGGVPVRLVVDDTETEYGTGEAHLLAVLKALALCRRRPPGDPRLYAASTPEGSTDESMTVAVLPWQGRGSEQISADYIVDERMLTDVSYGAGPSVSA